MGEVTPLHSPANESEMDFLLRVLKLLEREEYQRVGVVRTLHLDIWLVDQD